MTRLILLFALYAAILAACANVPLPATKTAQPTAQVTVLPERMIARVTVTPTIAVHQCAVSADVLTVRDCAGVQCAAIDWLMAGDIITTTHPITGWIPAAGGWVNSKFCEEKK